MTNGLVRMANITIILGEEIVIQVVVQERLLLQILINGPVELQLELQLK